MFDFLRLRTLCIASAACCIAAGIVFSPASAQQPYKDSSTVPDVPAYRRALQIVDIINANEVARARAYIDSAFAPQLKDRVPMEEHIGKMRGMYAGSMGFDIHSARAYEPPRPATNALLIVRNHLTEAWQAVVCDVEETPPYRIVSLNLAPARTPTDAPKSKRLTDKEMARELGRFVDRLAAADVFSGTVLLAKNGTVLMTKAVGIANRDFGAPVKLDTKLNTGSMFKMITAVAVAQLAERGALAFDDPISKYVGPEWLPRGITDKITIHHLLTHTSGLGSYFNETFDRSSRLLFRKLDDYKPLVQGDTLAFEPGSRWQYSNTGFLLLGVIIEKASGQDYFDYVREHVTGPAGMKNTDCYELDLVNENLAVGYDKEYGPKGMFYRNNIFAHVLRGGPAGGGYTTVEDLLKFDIALRSAKLLKKETLEKLWRAYPERSSPGYGYGFGVFETPVGRMVGHSGGFPGISANFNMYLDAGYTIAILSNYGDGMGPVDSKAHELIEAVE